MRAVGSGLTRWGLGLGGGWLGLMAAGGIAWAAGQTDVDTYEGPPDAAFKVLEVGQALTVNIPLTSVVPAAIYGNVTVQGDLTVQVGAAEGFRAAPMEGPGGSGDGMRAGGGAGYVAVGPWPSWRTANGLNVYWSMNGRWLLAFGPGTANTSPTGPKYLLMKSIDAPPLLANNYRIPAQWLRWRASYGGQLGHQGDYDREHDPVAFPSVQYAPMRVEANYILAGTNQETLSGGPSSAEDWQGGTQSVLIAADLLDAYPDPPAAPPGAPCTVGKLIKAPPEASCTFLQVGSAASGFVAIGAGASTWQTFSSREYKKDIEPLSPQALQEVLDQLEELTVYQFRYRAQAPDVLPYLGVMAEEAPEELVGPERLTLKTGEALAFVAAAIKGLHAENQALRVRLEALKRRQDEARQRGPARAAGIIAPVPDQEPGTSTRIASR